MKHISENWRKIVVGLNHFGLNGNYMGTHFGGSLFAMTDPFLMLMLIRNLGKQYNVWDKSAAIEFITPTRERVTATFLLDGDQLERIRRSTADGGKHFETFTVGVTDRRGREVAKVRKTIYIRKKPQGASLKAPL